MPWSYRKSVKIGPVRVNLSKGGIGYSVGGKFGRYGKTAKGRAYVSSSPLPGLRYQQTLSNATSRNNPSLPPRSPFRGHPVRTVALAVAGTVVLLAVIGATASNGKASSTATPVASDGEATITAANATIARGSELIRLATANTPKATAPPPTTTVAAPATASTAARQIVTVKDEAVNLRQSADVAAAVVTLVPPGTDATVIGEDATGPDGVTRYVHARVGDKEGYLRSDLVSAPRVGSASVPTTARTATPVTSTVVRVVTVTTEGAANLRSGPDTDSVVLAEVKNGGDATIIDEDVPSEFDDSHWVHVAYGAMDGYIRDDLVGAPHLVTAQLPTTASAVTVAPTSTRPATVLAAAPSAATAPSSGSSGGSSGGCTSNCTVHVSGYCRTDGRCVAPYVRSPPGTRSRK